VNAKSAESPAANAPTGKPLPAKAPAALPPATAPGSAHERGSLAYLLGAVGLIAIVGVLVMVFGVVHPPSLPSISSAHVTPPAGVAWTQFDDVDNCTALMVARPDGSVDRLACDDIGGDVLAWTADGIVTQSWAPSGQVLITRDATTGDVVTRQTTTADYGGNFASSVSSFRRGGSLVVSLDPGGQELWTVKVRTGYEVRAGAKSPDRAWVVMTDTADRLLLVSASGGTPAVWASDASTSWMAPVWEGTPIPSPISDPNKVQK
jgi:hypothetical protein